MPCGIRAACDLKGGNGHVLSTLARGNLRFILCLMKIQIASDLHLGGDEPLMPHDEAFRPVPDRDVLVLAGDLGNGQEGRDFVLRELAVSPVVFVPGNHEYCTHRPRAAVDADWQALAAEHAGLHYLIAEGVTLDGVRFWGAPWYSDLWGASPEEDSWFLRDVHMGIMDFWESYNGGGEWTLSRHIGHHLAQSDLLAMQAGRVDVVITHWPPTKEAIHPKYPERMNPYYINDREDLVRAVGAQLWISGHTHEAYDYEVGTTRCIGNPSGFLGEPRESPLFRPDRVVEVSP